MYAGTSTLVAAQTEAGLETLLKPGQPPLERRIKGSGLPELASPKQGRLLSLEVEINGSSSGTWVLLEREDIMYAPKAAFTQWRLNLRETSQPVQYRGESYWSIASVPGFESKLNTATQTLQLQFPPAAFNATHVKEVLAARTAADTALPAAFLTYDISATRNQTAHTSATNDVSALVELGVTGEAGVLSSSFVGRNLLQSSQGSVAKGWKRLETTWTYNMPARHETLRLGDSVTSRGLWGREVYFGGLQWGSNYALSPGLATHALPVVSGVSTAPSTVELYVNDALRQVSKVPAGPFTIDNFPMVSGAGDARIVVRDILGRETVTVQPFLTHHELLAVDLNMWNVSLGAPRLNLGMENDSYGPFFAAAQWRRGWSTGFTSELKLEAGRATQTLGAGATFALPGQHVASLAYAHSIDKLAGDGHLAVANVSRVSDVWAYAIQAQRSSAGFRSLGQSEGVGWQLGLSSSLRLNHTQQIGLAWVSSASPARSRFQTFNLTFNQRLGERASLVASLTKVQGTGVSNADWAVGLALMVPLEDGRHITASTTVHPGANQVSVAASESPRSDIGSGWHVQAGHNDAVTSAEAGYFVQGRQGMLSADIQASEYQQALRFGAQGGVLMTQGHVFATPKQVQSFALAEVKGHAQVGISANGRLNGVTNEGGIQLMMSLSPYQANAIRLNPQDLPISAELDNIEVSVNPPWRSVVKADFPVRAGRAALIRLLFDDGQPAPTAAIVAIENDKEQFYVARRGEAYVTGLVASNQLTLRWKDQSCRFSVELPASDRDTIPRLEPIVCKGVLR